MDNSFRPKHRKHGNIENIPFLYEKHIQDEDPYMKKKPTMGPMNRVKQLMIIIVVLLFEIQYFERIEPYLTIQRCQWKNWEKLPPGATPHHSIIIGDPQIVDAFSYPQASWLRNKFAKVLADNYLHRNHEIYHRVLKPDSILFIGDLFDGGREWEDDVWYDEYRRFNRIFRQHPGVEQFRQIPGNHDIGFGNGIEPDKYNRFKAFFGNADEVVLLGNHSIVLLDTVSLSDEQNPDISRISDAFLAQFEPDNVSYKKYPRIVLSHVPLYRFTELQLCGPLREKSKPFPVMRGTQYQTVLDYDMSQRIVNDIKPIMIFSGDDHDYCHIRHPINKKMSKDPADHTFGDGDYPGIAYVDEITVKSSAMTGGIKKPAIQLLSLWNPDQSDKAAHPSDNGLHEKQNDDSWRVSNDETSLDVDSNSAVTHLCYLPSPYRSLLVYIVSLVASVLWIIVNSLALTANTGPDWRSVALTCGSVVALFGLCFAWHINYI